MKMVMHVYDNGSIAVSGFTRRNSLILFNNAGQYVRSGKVIESMFLRDTKKICDDASPLFMKWLYNNTTTTDITPPFKMHKYKEGPEWGFNYIVVLFDVDGKGKCALIRNGYISLLHFEEYMYLKSKNKWKLEGNIAGAFLKWVQEVKC